MSGEQMQGGLTAEDARALAGSSFYAGMRVLPPAEREGMFAIYAFCRKVDDIADDMAMPRPERAARLEAWRGWITGLYHGGDAGEGGFLREAVARFDLAEEDFIAVIDGMAMDADADIRWPDFPTLDLYVDRVASAVGRLSVRVFGMERAPGVALAYHLGRALQFTNILRDLDEDADLGRVYMPAEAMAAAGIAITTPQAMLASPDLDKAARWLAAKAQQHYAEAHALLASKPRGLLLAPRLMEAAYADVLKRMLAQGWQAPRARVGTAKLRMLLLALRWWIFG